LTELENIAEILDRLGPGLFLQIDDARLATAFGHSLNWKARQCAQEFAVSHECRFSVDTRSGMGFFSRAYPKLGASTT
jgi:hypothetical protein